MLSENNLLQVTGNLKTNLTVLLDEGNTTKFTEIMKEVQKQKWSAHTTFVLSLSVHSWLMNDAKLDSLSPVFENKGFASLFQRGAD